MTSDVGLDVIWPSEIQKGRHFTVDETAGTVTCRNGLTRQIAPARNAVFGTACGNCPLRERCTTSKTGRSPCLHPHHRLLQAARTGWATRPDLQAVHRRHRPAWVRTRPVRRRTGSCGGRVM